jgi:hypothetical protein
MSLQDFLDKCPELVELHGPVSLSWSVPGVGFGQFSFKTKEDGTLVIDNELMSRDFIKHVLCMMVDQAELTIER